MRILFHSNQLGIRGSEVALFDYAFFNQTLLGNESAVAYDARAAANDPLVVAKFAGHFPLYAYEDFAEIDAIIARAGCERLYLIKAGGRDGRLARSAPNLVHAVFPTPAADFHGEVFAFVSEWLSRTAAGGAVPFVPHMINLPQHDRDLRADLRIPREAVVFASYGGSDCFDVPFVPDAMRAALEARSDLWFLFMNYPRFVDHPRVLFLERRADLDAKVAFINSADAMLHARRLGESFGIACGEFSSRNKPVLTFGGSPQRSHLEILADKALVYSSAQGLTQMLTGLSKAYLASGSWNCYSERFSPRAVMEKFRAVFLDA